MDNPFENDYNLGSLEKTIVSKFGFELFVTPRFVYQYTTNVYEAMTSTLVRQSAKGVKTFIDVGAHYGFFDVLVGLSNPNCKIMAFEPVSENCEILKRNLKLNDIEAEVYQAAVSEHAGHDTFQLSEASDNSGFISNDNAGVLREIDVEVVYLDQYLDQIPDNHVMVKIDTEGSELRVLEGMRGLIEKCSDLRLVIEFVPKNLEANGVSPQTFLERVDQLGFDIFSICDVEKRYEKYRPESGWQSLMTKRKYKNLYCVKKNHSLNLCSFSHSSSLVGAERSLLGLIENLMVNYGAICSVVLPDEGPLLSKLEELGAAIMIVNYQWWCAEKLPVTDVINASMQSSYENLFDQMPFIQKISPDVILSNTLVIPWGAAAALSINCPHVWWIKEYGEKDHGFEFYLTFQKTLDIIRESSNHVVVTSEAVKEALFKGMGMNECSVASNNVMISEADKTKRSFFRYPNSVKLLISGSVYKSKGQDDAVHATKRLLDRGYDVELCVVGFAENPFGDSLKEFIRAEKLEDRIHFYGFIENVRQVIEQADIGLTCSRNEAFGRTTVEALLMGKPVIGTNTGGTVELIDDGINGFLYSSGDIDQLTEKIAYFVDFPEKIVEFGKRAPKIVSHKLSKRPADAIIYQICQEIKGKHNPQSRQLSQLIMGWQQKMMQNLAARLVEREQVLQALSTQMNEQVEKKYRALQSLSTRYGDLEKEMAHQNQYMEEREQILQGLNSKLLEIYSSTAWKIVRWMWKVRLWLAPHGSFRERFIKENPLTQYILRGRRKVQVATVEEPKLAIVSKDVQYTRLRILVIDWRVPNPYVSAGERATVGILRDLSAIGYEVVFLPNDMESSPECEEELRRSGIYVVTKKLGYQFSSQFLNEQGHTFQAFYVIRVNVAEDTLGIIRNVAPGATVIFHLPDVYFLRESREAELKNDPLLIAKAAETRERELAIIRKVDLTVIVSQAELPVLRQYVPDVPISVFPVLYAAVVSKPAPFKARKDIFFLGGFEHSPNADAVLWFVSEIWPMVREQLPDVLFHIVGSNVPQQVLDLGSTPGVIVDGFVKDIDAFMSSIRLGVSPLRFGAGIKGKVCMTMGAGIPCVCTSISAEGLGIENGVHAPIADEPIAFAEAVVRLYKDQKLWTRFSYKGKELVSRHFSAKANRASLLKVLNDADILPLPLFIEYCKTSESCPIPHPEERDMVDVSVIIPVHNQWEYTRACINSILEVCAAEDIQYEIILADDCSIDETIHASEHYPGLRIIKTLKRVGFLRNCNNAVKFARGKYVLLLNNDTIVLPGWMTALYQLMEEDASAAIIGSKLLYPEGTIQEAGGILWNDATASNVGRHFPRNTPVWNQKREVDYVTGASFLVRKAFWKLVGGFDEGYKEAYCEDSDLAMLARANGMRVLYCPQSEVIHFEQKSYGTKTTEFKDTVRNENIERFYTKWREVFDNNHLPSDSDIFIGLVKAERSESPSTRARRNLGKFNILYFSPFPSHPSNHGNQSTIQQFGRIFQSLGHKVHFLVLQSQLILPGAVEDMRACWDTLDILPNTHPLGASGDAIPFDSWYQEGLGEQIHSLCDKYEIDIVFCTYIFQSKLLEFVPNFILKVIDTHDKMGNRYEMLRANSLPLEFFSCTPEEEGAYLRRADIVIARREEEARYFNNITDRSSAIVIPHFEAPKSIIRRIDNLYNVGILASANNINLNDLRKFLESLDRKLCGNTCPFTVHVAGQVKDMVSSLPISESTIFKKPWIWMHGFVQDIERFYKNMDVIVSPVTVGTGINVKTVQAMAYGMPLITTKHGSKGINTGDAMHSHTDLDTLIDSLFDLTNHPEELERLAMVSRKLYIEFYESSLATMKEIFNHPKLVSGKQ